MRETKAICSELARARLSASLICILAENQAQTEEWERFRLDKRGGFRRALIGGCWHQKVVGNRRRTNICSHSFGEYK